MSLLNKVKLPRLHLKRVVSISVSIIIIIMGIKSQSLPTDKQNVTIWLTGNNVAAIFPTKKL